MFYVITKNLFYFKIFQHNAKAGLLPRLCTKKKPFDVIYDSYKMKQFHCLLCIAKNCDWSRKTTPLSNLTRASLRVEGTYSESRIELRNLQILKKMLEKSSQFLSSEQPCEPKSLDVPLKITGVEKIPSDCGQLRGHLIRVLSERSVIDGLDFFSSVVGDSQSK